MHRRRRSGRRVLGLGFTRRGLPRRALFLRRRRRIRVLLPKLLNQRLPDLSHHKPLRDLDVAAQILLRIPVDLALDGLPVACARREVVVRVVDHVLRFERGRLVLERLLLRVGEHSPSVAEDDGDMAVVVFDGGGDHLRRGKLGAEDEECIRWAGDVSFA